MITRPDLESYIKDHLLAKICLVGYQEENNNALGKFFVKYHAEYNLAKRVSLVYSTFSNTLNYEFSES